MKKHIALLRGINVGGKRKLLMANLKKMLSHLGFENIITYIQSGNVIFEGKKETDVSGLEERIKEAILETFDLDVPVIIRTVEEIKAIAGENPFDQANIDQLHVTFLKEEPSEAEVVKIQTCITSADEFKIFGKNVYIQCSGRYSDSKLTNKFFEDKLKVSATTRNWKTILKLLELSR